MILLAFDENQYNIAYRRANYKEIRFNIPKEHADTLKEISLQVGKSVSQCIIDALEYYYNIDLHTRNPE